MTDNIQLYFNIIEESIKDILSTSFYDPVFIYHLPETKLKYRKPTGNFTHKFIQYPTFSEPGYHVIYLECKSYIYIHKEINNIKLIKEGKFNYEIKIDLPKLNKHNINNFLFNMQIYYRVAIIEFININIL
jgi:hypothetical protein